MSKASICEKRFNEDLQCSDKFTLKKKNFPLSLQVTDEMRYLHEAFQCCKKKLKN